jgi:hypothetical protein
MEHDLPKDEDAPPGTPTAPFRSDSAGSAGHQLDRHLRGLGPGPGKVFENHRGVSSKRSIPDRGPKQEG